MTKMKSVNKKIRKLTAELSNHLSNSMDEVTTAIVMRPTLDNLCTDRNSICRIHPETGELHQYLVYFPEYDDIAKIKYFLDAYLTTNEDVLEQKDITKLTYLISLLP